MKENIVLFGGGNQLQYSIDILEKENKFNIVGVIDSIQPIGKELYGYVCEINIIGGVITVGDNWSRKYIYDFIATGVPFPFC